MTSRFPHPSRLCALGLLFLCLGYSSLGEAAQAGRSYGESIRALKQSNWEKAEEKIREAMEDEGQALDSILISGSTRYPYLPFYVLGAALYGQGDCAGAVEAWEESLRQQHVRNSPNEYAELESGLQACRGRLAQTGQQPAEPPTAESPAVAEFAQQEPEPDLPDAPGAEPAATAAPAEQQPAAAPVDQRLEQLSTNVSLALGELQTANERYAALARDRDLAPEWEAEWKPALDVAERDRRRFGEALTEAGDRGDIAALQRIAADLEQAIDAITASRLQAEQRVDALQAARVAQAAARDEERERQEALEEQRRLAAIREQEAAAQRQHELEQRERVAAAQRTLQQALDQVVAATRETVGDERVTMARRELATQLHAGQALITNDDIDQLNRQSQTLRDRYRAYTQAMQEWDAAQREMALRTPPPALREVAKAYFAGDYEAVNRLAQLGQFSERRQLTQVLLFRSAANFNLYWLSSGEDSALLEAARKDVREIKGTSPGFTPYIAAFSPRFLEFFEES